MASRYGWSQPSRTSHPSSSIVLQDAFNNRMTLPRFTHLMSELGVDGPRQTCVETYIYKRLGEGAQFEVFKNVETDVVVKRVLARILEESDRQQLRDLELEIRALGDEFIHRHPSIVQLRGWGYDTVYPSSVHMSTEHTPQSRLLLPTLYVEPALSSLDDFLTESSLWEVRYQFCLDIAAGLECLRDRGILHNDLKPQNILIFHTGAKGRDYVAKLADFGLSVPLSEQAGYDFQDYGKTVGWRPPEASDYRPAKHGDCSTAVLPKSESFTYGLVALFTIFSPNKERPIRPIPQNSRKRKDKIELYLHENSTFSDDEKDKATTAWNIIESRFLLEKPNERENVSPDILELQADTFKNWASHFDDALQKRSAGTIPGRRPMHLNRRWEFYRTMQSDFVDMLMPEKLQSFDGYPGDLLFGMAVAKCFLKPGGYREDVKRLFNAAAIATPPSLRAMRILKRINSAIVNDSTDCSPENQELIDRALSEAEATGSLMALAGVGKHGPDAATTVLKAFRDTDAFNKERLVMSNHTPTELARTKPYTTVRQSRPTVEDPGYQTLSKDVRTFLVETQNTNLHLAAAFGEIELIRTLINDFDVGADMQNVTGETPLYKACVAGRYEAFMALLDLEANPCIRVGEEKITCLHWLFNFHSSHMDMVARRLISGGLKVDERTVQNGTSYHFVEYDHFPFHLPTGSPLHWAACMDNTAAVDVFIKHGALVDECDALNDSQAQTALSMAMYRGSPLMVRHLLSAGADACRVDGRNCTTLHMLTADYGLKNRLFPSPKVFDQWCYHGDYETCLRNIRDCIDAVKAAGASLEVKRQGDNSTPLLDAAINKDIVATRALLEAGADVNSCGDWSGKLPLHFWVSTDPEHLAYPNDYFRVLEILLDTTQDVSITRDYIVHLTLRGNGTDPVFSHDVWKRKLDMLLNHRKHAIRINNTDETGITVLLELIHTERRKGLDHMESMRTLISLGANLHARDKHDRDFLWFATHNNSLGDDVCYQAMEYYLQDVTVSEKATVLNRSRDAETGVSALMLMCERAYIKCVRLALALGANPIQTKKNGETALDYAIECGNSMRLELWRAFSSYTGRLPTASDEAPDSFFWSANYRASMLPSGPDDIDSIKYRYFALPEIRDVLVKAGAKTGKQLGKRANAPDVKLKERYVLEEFGVESFDVKEQPYFHLWEDMYRFDDDTEEDDAALSWHKPGWTVPAAIRALEPWHEVKGMSK